MQGLIPLDLDGYLFDEWTGGLAESVKERVAADFKSAREDDSEFAKQLERLMRALRLDERGRQPPPESTL